ncbi:agglutinin-like protein [Rhynchospora pubera]|uniref:Agglutinin-like protein n=1 Tax=Rhynchospora pubera TaxID=906938 RepID=A0AAV8C5Y0_9POAL|nr:agglutinin-like protein [Rhynchospora pubera]
MMFDWNDQDQVGDTIWAEFGGGEDHIVPYPKGTEDNNSNNNNNSSSNNNNTTYLNFGDPDNKKLDEEESDDILNFSEQDEQNNTVKFQDSNMQDQTDLQSKLDLESWPDLPSLNGTLGREYNNGNRDDSMASTYLNDFDTNSNLDKVEVQLEAQPDDFHDGHEGKGNSFLDCDWGNIGDFEDFDRLFSNGDSIFGTEMGGNGGEFLSQPSDVINGTVQSIPIPHLQFGGDEASGHGSSSATINDLSSGGRIKPHEKAENEKKIPKSRKKAEERSKTKTSQRTITSLPPGPLQGTVMNTLPPPMVGQHLQVNPTNFVFPGYRYPAYIFPASQVTPKEASVSSYKRSEKLEKPVIMTPQEKIEKLRRRQQMQAMLAIQQQQQQLGHQILGNDNLVPQGSSPRNQNQNPDSIASSAVIEDSENKGVTSEPNMTRLPEECGRGSIVSDDPPLEETIYYQLQDALAKLDVRIRLCIRDSLLRLAQSAMERQSASDRSSTNFSTNPSDDNESLSQNDFPNTTKRFMLKIGEGETGTNPIDRTVAQLLFHKLSEKSAFQVKEEAPLSPSSFNPDSKVSGSKSEENMQNAGEMEVHVQPAH